MEDFTIIWLMKIGQLWTLASSLDNSALYYFELDSSSNDLQLQWDFRKNLSWTSIKILSSIDLWKLVGQNGSQLLMSSQF